jgi:asparagine synthase (glutamine-hydrolysing)
VCGIVASVSFDGPGDPEPVRRGLAVLGHRGPDDSNVWSSADGRVHLGHRRLSIIDLESGRQPLAGHGGQHQLVVNGELYEHDRIRAELVARGHRFQTHSDSEIALPLYEERGLDFVDELRGEFALVLWDGALRRVVACRDRFGIKPLVYGFLGSTLLIASEAKALFAAGIPARWDLESVHHSMSLQFPLPDRTLFAGIRQVPPGHMLVASAGTLALRRYWDLGYAGLADAPAPTPAREDELVDEVRAELDRSISIRRRADVPIAYYLSGGIDSAAVVGLAARQTTTPLDVFTIGFEDAAYDETALARSVADHVGARFHPVAVSNADIAAHFAEATANAEFLAINTHGVAKFLLSRAVRASGAKVVLTGEGADEFLGGYQHFRLDVLDDEVGDDAERAARVDQLRAANRTAGAIMFPEHDHLSVAAAERAFGVVPTWLRTKASIGLRGRGLLAAEVVDAFRGRDVIADFIAALPPDQLAIRDRLRLAMYTNAKGSLANYILTILGDRAEMAHSIEGRVPFLDHRLFEKVRSLPRSMLIRDATVEKYVLRRAVKDLVPAAVWERRKHGFAAPSSSHSRILHELIEDTLSSRPASILDRGRLAALLARLRGAGEEERASYEPTLIMALSASALERAYRLT